MVVLRIVLGFAVFLVSVEILSVDVAGEGEMGLCNILRRWLCGDADCERDLSDCRAALGCCMELGANCETQLAEVRECLVERDLLVGQLLAELEDLRRDLCWSRVIPRGYWVYIRDSAAAHGIDPILIAGQIQRENSAWDTFRPGDGGKARGLGQFWEMTWQELMGTSWDQAWIPEKNIEAMARYHDRYGGWLRREYGLEDPVWSLASYNWGSGQVRALLNKGGAWEDVPEVVRMYAEECLEFADEFMAECLGGEK